MKLGHWLTRHAQNAIGTLGTLSRNPLATILTVMVIGIALALPAALGVFVQTGRSIAGSFEETRDFSVYLNPGVPADKAEAIARELRGNPVVAQVKSIPAETALAELRRDPAFASVMDALDGNPLPHTLVVRPNAGAGPAEIQALAEDLRGRPGVDLVKLDADWLQRLNAILDLVRRTVLIAAVLLVTAVVVIVGNTIRLDIQGRADEIEVAKLLGATDAFVRRPFLYLGLWYGLLGGVMALLLLLAGLAALKEPVTRLAGLYGRSFGLEGPALGLVLTVLAGGVLAGLGGAWTAVARHLAAIKPKI